MCTRPRTRRRPEVLRHPAPLTPARTSLPSPPLQACCRMIVNVPQSGDPSGSHEDQGPSKMSGGEGSGAGGGEPGVRGPTLSCHAHLRPGSQARTPDPWRSENPEWIWAQVKMGRGERALQAFRTLKAAD